MSPINTKEQEASAVPTVVFMEDGTKVLTVIGIFGVTMANGGGTPGVDVDEMLFLFLFEEDGRKVGPINNGGLVE